MAIAARSSQGMPMYRLIGIRQNPMTKSAAELDARDPLAAFADEFFKPPGIIYLDGNSLGLMCKPAEAALKEAIESWRSRAILGWTDGPEPWFDMSRKA